MVKGTCRLTARLLVLIIAASGCSDANSAKGHALGGASPKTSASPVPPDEPRGPPQDLSRKLLERKLTGTRLVSVKDDGEWSFTEKTFVLQAGKTAIATDLLTAILGPDTSASRIEGKWHLEDAKGAPIAKYIGVMVLSDIRGDGKEGLKEVRLETQAAERQDPDGVRLDNTRLDIGGHQYTIMLGKP